jgi:hypothetical protein
MVKGRLDAKALIAAGQAWIGQAITKWNGCLPGAYPAK